MSSKSPTAVIFIRDGNVVGVSTNVEHNADLEIFVVNFDETYRTGSGKKMAAALPYVPDYEPEVIAEVYDHGEVTSTADATWKRTW